MITPLQRPYSHGCRAVITGTAVFFATVGAVRPAYAQSAAAEAERLFNEGREAMQAHDYARACENFNQSDRLEHAVGTLFNLANCEEQRGRVFTASTLFRHAREQLAAGDRRIAVADEHVSLLALRVPHVRLTVVSPSQQDIRVRVDGAEIDSTASSAPLALDPGIHTIAFRGPGQHEQAKAIELRERELLEVAIPFDAPAAQQPASPSAPPPSNDRTHGGAPVADNSDRFLGLERRTTAYLVGGVGVAGLLAGAITGILGLHQEAVGNANCSDATRTCNHKGVDANGRARSLATASSAGFVLGIVGVGLGSYLYVTAEPTPTASVARNHPERFSVSWSGRW